MGKISLFLFVIVVAVIAAGAVALLTMDIPPPSSQVEKVLPDDRFPR